jgi:hypothetical protein
MLVPDEHYLHRAGPSIPGLAGVAILPVVAVPEDFSTRSAQVKTLKTSSGFLPCDFSWLPAERYLILRGFLAKDQVREAVKRLST